MAVKVFQEACRALRVAAIAPLVLTFPGVPIVLAQAPAATGPAVGGLVEDSGSITAAPERFAPAPGDQPVPTPPPEPQPEASPSVVPEAPAQSGGDPSSETERAEQSTPPDAADVAEPTDAPAAGPTPNQAEVPSVPGRSRLVVRSWAGAYGAAQVKAVIEPMEQALDIDVERRDSREGAPFAGVDVVELDQEALAAACGDGRLRRLADWPSGDAAGAGANGPGDFLVATDGGCGLPTFAWSSLVLANTTKMKELAGRRYREPGQIGDLLDTGRYPGKRALVAEPRRLLETMLLASGVDRGQLYQVLATRRGEDEAFKLLDTLAPSILWVAGAREAMEAVNDGRATMATVFSGRAFRALIAGEFKPIWDGHIIDYASWALTRETGRAELAAAFVRGAVAPERLAGQARLWPYGPMRRTAVEMARRHALLDVELEPYLPTSELRFGQGVIFDARFWMANGKRIADRFADWQAGVPLGIRVPPPRRAPPPPLPPPPRQARFN